VFLQGGGDQRCASVPDSNSQAARAATCFQDRLLIRPDDLHMPKKFRGLESNQRPPGSEPGVTTSSNCPGVVKDFGKEDSNLHRLIQSQEACRLADSRFKCVMRGSNPPVRFGRPVPYAARPMTRIRMRKGRESNPQGLRSPGFGPGAVANRLALPSIIRRCSHLIINEFHCSLSVPAPGAGIEPAGSSLTVRHMNQLMLPR
jgi:hypothetical protein